MRFTFLRSSSGLRLASSWRCLWLGIVLAGFPAAASAQSIDKPTALLETVSNSLGMLEIVHTEACVQQLRCHEANPVMPDGTSTGATAGRAAIKAGGQAVSTWLILKASKSPSRKLVWAARATSIGKIVLNGYLAARAMDYQR